MIFYERQIDLDKQNTYKSIKQDVKIILIISYRFVGKKSICFNLSFQTNNR